MKKILVIEDNENNMELISFMLKSSGYEVLQAYRGQDGFDMARIKKPDLILLDIQLPDIDGTVVLDNLRSTAETQAIPVVAVTSYAMTGDSKKLLSAGCDGYIEKPIEPGLFISQVETILTEKTPTVI